MCFKCRVRETSNDCDLGAEAGMLCGTCGAGGLVNH
jgi:hypothetical protein